MKVSFTARFCFAAFLAFSVSVAAQNYSIEQYLSIKSAGSPQFSTDGKSIAYLTNVSGTQQIWVVDLAGGKPQQITNYDDNIGFFRWLPDGTMFFGKAKGGGAGVAHAIAKYVSGIVFCGIYKAIAQPEIITGFCVGRIRNKHGFRRTIILFIYIKMDTVF